MSQQGMETTGDRLSTLHLQGRRLLQSLTEHFKSATQISKGVIRHPARAGLSAILLASSVSPFFDARPVSGQTVTGESAHAASVAAGPNEAPRAGIPLEELFPGLTPDVLGGLGPAVLVDTTSATGRNSVSHNEAGAAVITVTGPSNNGQNSAAFEREIQGLHVPAGSSVVVATTVSGSDRSRTSLVLKGADNSSVRGNYEAGTGILQITTSAGGPPQVLAQERISPSDANTDIALIHENDGKATLLVENVQLSAQTPVLGDREVAIAAVRTGPFNPDDQTPAQVTLSNLQVLGFEGQDQLAYNPNQPTASSLVLIPEQQKSPSLGLVYQKPLLEVGDGPWAGNLRACIDELFDKENVECRQVLTEIPIGHNLVVTSDIENARIGEHFVYKLYFVRKDGSLGPKLVNSMEGYLSEKGHRLKKTSFGLHYDSPGSWEIQLHLDSGLMSSYRFNSR